MSSSMFVKKVPKRWVGSTEKTNAEANVIFYRFAETLLVILEKEFSVSRSAINGRNTPKAVLCRKIFVYLTVCYFPDISHKLVGSFIGKTRFYVGDTIRGFYPDKDKNVKRSSSKVPEEFHIFLKKISEELKNTSIAQIVSMKKITVTPESFYEAGVSAGFSDDEILRFSVRIFGA